MTASNSAARPGAPPLRLPQGGAFRDSLEASGTETVNAPESRSIIPVGKEPLYRPSDGSGSGVAGSPPEVPVASDGKGKIRDPERHGVYMGRLEEVRVFTTETMRGLRRAETQVWMAIFNCQMNNAARISQDRISELAGTSKRHVGEAIRSLAKKGLLRVLSKGSYRSGGGLASVYRVYPSPNLSLVAKSGGPPKPTSPKPKPKPR